MNMHPIHFAPHHTGHLPLCGARTIHHGGDVRLLLCTLERDDTTCFKCIDQYEERLATEAQVRDDIEQVFAEMDFSIKKRACLHAIDHMIAHTPWWNLSMRFRLARGRRELAALTFEDVK